MIHIRGADDRNDCLQRCIWRRSRGRGLQQHLLVKLLKVRNNLYSTPRLSLNYRLVILGAQLCFLAVRLGPQRSLCLLRAASLSFTLIPPSTLHPRLPATLPATATVSSVEELRSKLLDAQLPLFERYRAMFALQNLALPRPSMLLPQVFSDDSASFILVLSRSLLKPSGIDTSSPSSLANCCLLIPFQRYSRSSRIRKNRTWCGMRPLKPLAVLRLQRCFRISRSI
jgi:hypothetical protein